MKHNLFLFFIVSILSFSLAAELDPPAKSNEFSNKLYGVYGGLTLVDPSARFFISGELDLALGDVLYDGSTQDLSTGVIAPYTDTSAGVWLDMVAKGGIQFTEESFLLRFYTGLGLYSWNRAVCKEYLEKYSYWYMPFGFAGDFFLNEYTSIGFDAGVTAMLLGKIDVYFDMPSNLDAEPNAKMVLGNAQGYYCSFPIKFYFDDLGFVLAPYYMYRPIAQSDTDTFTDGYYVYEIYEPSSSTILSGIKLWASYAF